MFEVVVVVPTRWCKIFVSLVLQISGVHQSASELFRIGKTVRDTVAAQVVGEIRRQHDDHLESDTAKVKRSRPIAD